MSNGHSISKSSISNIALDIEGPTLDIGVARIQMRYDSWENHDNHHICKDLLCVLEALMDAIYPLDRIETWVLLENKLVSYARYIIYDRYMNLYVTWHGYTRHMTGLNFLRVPDNSDLKVGGSWTDTGCTSGIAPTHMRNRRRPSQIQVGDRPGVAALAAYGMPRNCLTSLSGRLVTGYLELPPLLFEQWACRSQPSLQRR